MLQALVGTVNIRQPANSTERRHDVAVPSYEVLNAGVPGPQSAVEVEEGVAYPLGLLQREDQVIFVEGVVDEILAAHAVQKSKVHSLRLRALLFGHFAEGLARYRRSRQRMEVLPGS